MKTAIKIAVLTAFVALAVISCAPELPGPHNEWWDEYNEQYDGSKYITGTNATNQAFTITKDLEIGSDRVNTVTIEFLSGADILKKDNLEAELKNFLSFWSYTPNPFTYTPGKATELSELKDWEFQKRNDRQITVKLNSTFVAASSSNVVLKIDGSKYTYSNGQKMDRDGNGITGEAGYDDYYVTLSVTGITYATVSPTLPGNKSWGLTLVNLSTGSGTTDSTTAADLVLANTSGIIAGTASGNIDEADRDAVLKALVGGFKIEKFSGVSWSNHATASYDDTNHRIIAKDNTFSHMTGYRIVFEKGSISLETEKEFFGVKQRITINGGTLSIYNTLINRTRVEGNPRLYYNSDKRTFTPQGNPSVEVYSQDGFKGNIVLRASLISGQADVVSGTSHYFKQVDFATFKNNFKIYTASEFSSGAALLDATNAVEIDITAVDFKREGIAAAAQGYNVIYITLDPSYRTPAPYSTYEYFYIGEGICYNSNVGVFSGTNIWQNNGFSIVNSPVDF
jgi:hypothetical protein